MFTIGGELCVNAMKWYGSIPASFTFIRKEPLFLFTLFIILRLSINNQKQLAKGVLSKSCSENMQQIYKRTTLLKSHFGMVFSCKFAACFQNTFYQGHLWVAASEKSNSILSSILADWSILINMMSKHNSPQLQALSNFLCSVIPELKK